MILVWLIGILLLGGILAWLSARWNSQLPRWISLAAVAVDLALSVRIWVGRDASATKLWIDEADWNWVPSFGIHFHLAVDGLSLLLLLLTFFLGILSVLASWTEIRERVGFFHLNLMWVLAGIASVFLAVDLFLFYFAWELMLVPMYFLIVIWGHEHRVYAALKFFLFTQFSGLLMLIAILALYFLHHRTTGVYTFQYSELLGTQLGSGAELAIMLGFFAAFAAFRCAPVSARCSSVHPGGTRAGRDRNRLWRGDGFLADRSETPGRLHQRRSPGIRAARDFLLEPARATGRAHDHDLSRAKHGWTLHSSRRFTGTHSHP